MKRMLALLLVLALMLAGCGERVEKVPEKVPVTLRIVTTYGADDGNRASFEAAVAEYEQITGNRVEDKSNTSNENWKARVIADFETSSEPDVLFYFTGADAEQLIRAGKVVSLEEIQTVYPDYADNMASILLPVASDGLHYAVPITGYWENLFYNKPLLEQCGVGIPGADYQWEQFLADCRKIRDAGVTPIACSLAEISHYWFEFAVLNNGTAQGHSEIPQLDSAGHLVDDAVAQKWVDGLEDLKQMYEEGLFPANTLTAGDAETVDMFGKGQAAFLLDGSWKVGFLSKNYPEQAEGFLVCHVPSKGGRTYRETIGGISTGFFITRKAWDNPEKRQAAVEFVSHLTSVEVIRTFVTSENTALAKPIKPVALGSLQRSAAYVMATTSRWVGAVQDLISGEARACLFDSIPDVVSGKLSPHDAVARAMAYDAEYRGGTPIVCVHKN